MRESVSTGERERDPRERESERRNQGEKKREKGALPPLAPAHSAPLGGARPGRRPSGGAGRRRPPAEKEGAAAPSTE